MDQKEKDIQLIDRYLRGATGPDEKAAFEQRLLTDAAFLELYEERKVIAEAARRNLLADKLDQLKKLDAEIEEISDESLELINRQLLDQLDTAEKIVFKDKLADPLFRQQYHQLRLLKDGIIRNRKQQLLNKLEDWEQAAPPLAIPQAARRIPLQRVLRWAAVILLLLAAGLWWQSEQPADPEQLFAEYFEAYPGIFITRAGDTEMDPSRRQAYAYYESGRFQNAIPLLEKLGDRRDTVALFYLGNACLATGNSNKAIIIFTSLQNLNNQLASPSRWLLGLAHLKEGQQQQARSLFEELKKSNSSYSQKASKILDHLNKEER